MGEPKLCRVCNTRKIGTGATVAEGDIREARRMELCVPCSVQAEWDNEHSDAGHEANSHSKVDACWACHPELNPDFDGAPEPRKGTSRAGVVHCIRRTDTGRDKARTVAAYVTEGFNAKPTVRSYAKGTVSCRIVTELAAVRLDWDAEGHFLKSSKIEFDGRARKVRNVSEAYRLLGQLATA